ncbi:MAG TPA: DUF664 domain-containing protein [Acidimicrobiales bacterium]|nr:DUF664 domain-containing protein [Acidimicrobiales bacterium]
MDYSLADELETMLGITRRNRNNVIATTAGLTDEQARWTPDGALLPIIGIINHLTHMEWRWIEGRYLGAEFPERTEEFVVGAERSLDEVIASYREREARTEEVLRAAPDLGATCLGSDHGGPPAHVLLGLPGPVTLRWVGLHILEETAHHAGHADATRELLDGTKMSG